MGQKPTVGRIVQYRQARGSQAWLPAIVTVTEETFVPGFWVNPSDEERLRLNNGQMRDHAMTVDREGEVWVPSPMPPVRETIVVPLEAEDGSPSPAGEVVTYHYVHLQVFSPMGPNYHEFNVLEGDEPGNWRWLPREVEVPDFGSAETRTVPA